MEEVYAEMVERQVETTRVIHQLRLDCLMESWWRRGRPPELLEQAMHVFHVHIVADHPGFLQLPPHQCGSLMSLFRRLLPCILDCAPCALPGFGYHV